MKIRPVGAELFRADRQKDRRTDMTKLIDVFRNFANAPKILTVFALQMEIQKIYVFI